jgi:hypothetical protein
MNRKANYFSFVGSFDGAVKVAGRWIRIKELNRIHKEDWTRWQGPPSPALARALQEPKALHAHELFPERIIPSMMPRKES